MNIQSKIEATKQTVEGVGHHHQCAFVNVRSLQAVRAERVAQMKFQLQHHAAPEVFNISNSTLRPLTFACSEEAHAYSAIISTLAIWETSPEFLEAEGIIQPMLDEIAKLEADLAAENVAAGLQAQARRDAIEEATAKALADIAAKFPEPSSEPAPPEPAPPFRGKGLKPVLATA